MTLQNRPSLYESISALIAAARSRVRTTVNQEMVQTYWGIGQLIVEEEQAGASKAEYGKAVLEGLAERLTAEYGKGFAANNLRYMRQFYSLFPICHALRDELSWTHYRLLLKVENESARLWYMAEAANEGWSTRALERQINSFYYERILSSQDEAPVRSEAAANIRQLTPRDILKDPVVLEFLELEERASFTESELETGLSLFHRLSGGKKRLWLETVMDERTEKLVHVLVQGVQGIEQLGQLEEIGPRLQVMTLNEGLNDQAQIVE
jgi:hypothetical protein